MELINEQVERLRVSFNTKNIFNETILKELTDEQMIIIEDLIKRNKGDGCHKVDCNISVHLKQGKCYIKTI